MKVSECHSQGTVHIPASCSLREAATQMSAQHVGALVVTDGDGARHIVGIVTDRDIVVKSVAQGASPFETPIGAVMTPSIAAIDESADLAEAMQIMATHGVRRLAVTREGTAIVGILSLDDLIGALGHDWTMLASIVRNEQNVERSASVQTPLHM